MDKNHKKKVILSYEAGDWFDKIPFANLCDGGITAINVDRRFGKSTFIVNAVMKILLQNMADYINIECGDKGHAKYMKMAFKKVFGNNFEALFPQISIRPDGSGCTFTPFDKRRTVTFVDEFNFVAAEHEIRKILTSELNADAQTWILLDTSYEASQELDSKNSFAGLLEMPFVRSYEIVGRIPEECLVYYDDEEQQAIKKRQKVFRPSV